jgi:Icc protein
MPIHLLPPSAGTAGHCRRVSRRRFLAGALSSSALLMIPARWGGPLAAGDTAPAAEKPLPAWALLADTHIAASDAGENAGSNMARNLQRVVEEVIAAAPRGAIIDGDIARLDGKPGDYERLLAHTAPLAGAGVSLHLTLGNHDHRENFLHAWKAKPVEAAQDIGSRQAAVSGKHAGALIADGHHWLFLDSLETVNATPGSLGEAQRNWLAARLDGERELPALLFVHHNVESTPVGLQDTGALLNIVAARPQVKAIFFGHTHTYRRWEVEGVHLVNLPATGYAFSKNEPLGWVKATIVEGGMELELRSIDPAHPAHGRRERLAWRAPPEPKRREPAPEPPARSGLSGRGE